ncbi:IclR family transcriptional regulator [Marinibaculum pumilum]|uniref:IclR family transcriptional regulator n=1 Tax=Marinibaculum pumilum TaxID=1766165 RepID=A0ABV7L5D0_9PROT
MQTIRKIGAVLRCFSAERPERRVSELARELGYSVSGAHDLVAGLARIGLLAKVSPGQYRLGPLVASLNRVLEESSPLVEAARPVLNALREEYGETLHLTQHDHDALLIVSQREGTRAVRVASTFLSGQVPLHACAPGWLHLSTENERVLHDYVALRSGRPGGIVDPAGFLERIQALKGAADVADDGGYDKNISCCAAWIRDHTGRPVAVLSLSIPRSRFADQPRAFRAITREAAGRISGRLGLADLPA